MTDTTADEKSSPDRFRTTSDDFIRFLEATAPASPCSVCLKKKWTVLCDPDDGGVSYRITSPIKNADRPGVVSEFLVYCSNCGHTRRFMSRSVHRWVQNNPIESDSEQPAAIEEPEELGPDENSEPAKDEP